MNKEDTLALYAQGRDAWNAWAERMLAWRKALEDAGEWASEWDDPRKYHAMQNWLDEARVDFEGHAFPKTVDFQGFVFPDRSDFIKARFHEYARFGGAIFSSAAEFGDATFFGDVWFRGATFSGDAWFEDVTFSGDATFGSATFSSDAWFKGVTFDREAGFGGATFSREAWFGDATFSGKAWFRNANFFHDAWFRGLTFRADAEFKGAIFSREAWFDKVTFGSEARFEGATFPGDARFGGARFDRYTVFTGAEFLQWADFTAIEVNRAFTLAGVEFKKVPDFTQAHFAEAPLLDDIQVPLNERGASVRYRSLKRLAIQGHDHLHELDFFAAELKALGGIMRPLVFLYELVSNFGRSIGMPIVWWLIGLSAVADAYLAWAGDACVEGAGNPIDAAFLLSFHRALPPTGLGNETKLKEVHACLYGEHIPDLVALLGVVQSLISLVLIFLVLLAIRNHFRLR